MKKITCGRYRVASHHVLIEAWADPLGRLECLAVLSDTQIPLLVVKPEGQGALYALADSFAKKEADADGEL